MKPVISHAWNLEAEEAVALQRQLSSRIIREAPEGFSPRLVAGTDLSPPDAQGQATAAAVVLSLPGLEIKEVKVARGRPGFPYVPGLLSFRETPLIVAALERLRLEPDILILDGQGILHPRRFGIASHVGLLMDKPAIGCAKSLLLGKHTTAPDIPGSYSKVVDDGEIIGAAVWTKRGANPVYVSIGHMIDLASAIQLCLACCKGYRVPEPTRLAHLAAAGRLSELEPSSAKNQQSIQARLELL